MNIQRIILSVFGAMLLIFLASCNKENFDFNMLSKEIELDPVLIAPLFFGSVTMEDIVEMVDSMGYTEIDSEGFIYLIYSDTAFAVKADTVVDIPDKFITKYYIESDITGDPGWGIDVGDTVYFEKQDSLSYGLEGNDRLDSMLIKAGTLQIDLLSEFRHTGFLTISSDYIIDDQGNPFSTTFLISDLSGDFTDQQLFDLDGYFVSTEQTVEGDSTFTYVVMDYNLALIYSGNTIEVGEEVAIDISFLDTDFSSIFGFIDQREVLNESGEIDVPLYTERPELASIIFADPRINISTNNSIGIPLELELDNMIATSAIDGSTMELTFDGINPFEIGAPDIDRIGETVETEININNTNSNIDELLASAPSTIAYDIIGRTIYENLSDEHFVLDESMLEMNLEFVLPMNLKTTGYALSDTIEFELFGEDGIDPSMVDTLEIDMGTLNGLPFEFEVQVYFTDDNYTVIDSLFKGTVALLEAAPVDANGIVTSQIEAANAAAFNSEKLANMESVTWAIFQAKIITTNSGQEFVKIYTDYELDFDLSLYGKFRINNYETGN